MEPRGIREHHRKPRDTGTPPGGELFRHAVSKFVNVWKFLSRQFESEKSMMGLRRHSGMRPPECSADSQPGTFYRPTLDQGPQNCGSCRCNDSGTRRDSCFSPCRSEQWTTSGKEL